MAKPRSELSVEEFEKKLREVMDFIYDKYLPNATYVGLMTGAPLFAAFCEDNRKSIADTTILLMAFQIICKEYGFAYWFEVDVWVKHFKKVVLEHLLEEK